jgi:DNA-directed RNA polymerase subunit alpha
LSHLVVPSIECVESTESFGCFQAEPLEKGLGVTLGNALRRVLLGYLPGAAITWIKIDGIQYEFAPIPYVKEDTVEFLLNIKMIRLRSLTGRPGKLLLEAGGEGRVCAADIKPSADFEIANPELYLATLDSPEARLCVEFNAELGMGYKQAETSDNLPVDAIPVDAIFTPIRKANFAIEPTHVGRETNCERLRLEVWTDGTITPVDAVSYSADILAKQLAPFAACSKTSQIKTEEEVASLSIEEQYNMPVEQLGLSVRTMNCLRRGDIATVGELIAAGEKKLLSLRNFGQKSKQEIEERLRTLNLSLAPQVEEEGKALQQKGEAESSQ